MKIVKADHSDRELVNNFISTSASIGFTWPPEGTDYYPEPIGTDWFSRHADHGMDVYLVLDSVVCEEGQEPVYALPKVGADMLVAIVVVDNAKISDIPEWLHDNALVTYIHAAKEYSSYVSLTMMLQDFVEHVILNGVPYKCLWLPQSKDGEERWKEFSKAVVSSDLATGYINVGNHADEGSGLHGMAGYCIDLRVGHYLLTTLNRRKPGEE